MVTVGPSAADGIERLLQRQVNETVAELVCSQGSQAELSILNHSADRHALRREDYPAERNALLLPSCRDLQEISILRQQYAAKGRRPLQ